MENENLQLDLPIKIDYTALEALLQQKLQGKILSKGKPNGDTSDTAKIESIALRRSKNLDFDLVLHLRIKLLTTLFRNKEFELELFLALDFDPESQEISIRKYVLEGENTGWLTNTLMETLVNTLLYGILKKKLKFDLHDLIQTELEKLNRKLSGGIELKDGIFLSGRIFDFQIKTIKARQDHLSVDIRTSGVNVLNIKKISL